MMRYLTAAILRPVKDQHPSFPIVQIRGVSLYSCHYRSCSTHSTSPIKCIQNQLYRKESSLKHSSVFYSSFDTNKNITTTGTIRDKLVGNSLGTKGEVDAFLAQLSLEQKTLLLGQLNLNMSHQQGSDSYHEMHNYLSKFGRPSTYVEGFEDPSWRKSSTGSSASESGNTSTLDATSHDDTTPASARDLYAVGLKNALPFVGFGFLDNLIMIIAGDYIDLRIGTVLGISTMAAAALGNTISDVAGIGLAWYVEHFTEKFGIHTPKLTPFQVNTWRVRWSVNFGRAIGVVIGCLLGMIPLLFLSRSDKTTEKSDPK